MNWFLSTKELENLIEIKVFLNGACMTKTTAS